MTTTDAHDPVDAIGRPSSAPSLTVVAIRGLVRAAITVLLVWAVLALGGLLSQRAGPGSIDDGYGIAPPRPALDRLETRQQLDRLEAALEVYRLTHERYPPALDALVEEGLVSARALRFPNYEEPYFYRPTADNFELYPPRF